MSDMKKEQIDEIRAMETSDRKKGYRRAQVLRCLEDGPKTVQDMAEIIGCSIGNVRHPLRYLRQANLVRVDYIDPETMQLVLSLNETHEEEGRGP